MTGWLRMLRAELPLLRDLPDLRDRPLPRVAVALGPALPGRTLRAAAAIATGTMLALAAQRVALAPGLAWTLVGIAVGVMAIWPATAVAHVVTVASGLLIALDGYGPFDPLVFGLVPLAYAAVRLAWWAERVSLPARVEIAALTRGLWPGLVLVGGTAGFGALASLLAGRPSAIAVVAGGAALVVLARLAFVRAR